MTRIFSIFVDDRKPIFSAVNQLAMSETHFISIGVSLQVPMLPRRLESNQGHVGTSRQHPTADSAPGHYTDAKVEGATHAILPSVVPCCLQSFLSQVDVSLKNHAGLWS